MKNPRPVYNERSVLSGFQCHLLIMRDGRTQQYAATVLVEVGDGRTLQSSSEFTIAPGTKQHEAVDDIILAAVPVTADLLDEAEALMDPRSLALDEMEGDALVRRLDERLAEARKQNEVSPGKLSMSEAERIVADVLIKGALRGLSPIEAVEARLAEVDAAEAHRDPFGPVRIKAKTYLN
jgi:hypothetical protein